MNYFDEIRNSLLIEARQSPNLLSDLAGLENYIAEGYHNRSFIELLQNADDARATKFKIIRKNDFLFVANNGRIFNKADLESLCRSAASNKVRETSIGYRGIGFKSVVSFAKKIHLVSRDLKLSFSKELTKIDIPKATNVPLIRIPHKLSELDELNINPTINELKVEGYSTVFIFGDILVKEIEDEFISFNYLSLLFLRNIRQAEILIKNPIKVMIVEQNSTKNKTYLEFQNNTEKSDWLLINDNENVLAFNLINKEINRLKEDEAVVHAFLPTEDLSGLGIIINGDFNTEPSRRHVIFDTYTTETIDKICNLILFELKSALNQYSEENKSLISALIPYHDPRVAIFRKQSFSTSLYNSLKKNSSSFFKNLKLCPSWFNASDFYKIAQENEIATIHKSFYEIDGLIEFLKFLGSIEASFDDFSSLLKTVSISNIGCAEVLSFLVKKSVLNGINKSQVMELPLFVSNGEKLLLSEIINHNKSLDETFVNYLYENGLTQSDIKTFLSKLSEKEISNNILSITNELKDSNPIHEEIKTSDTILNWLNTSGEQTKSNNSKVLNLNDGEVLNNK